MYVCRFFLGDVLYYLCFCFQVVLCFSFSERVLGNCLFVWWVLIPRGFGFTCVFVEMLKLFLVSRVDSCVFKFSSTDSCALGH